LVNTGTNAAPVFKYEYNLKDHLGNNRVTFLGKNLGGGAVEVLQQTNYYPFGMIMTQSSNNNITNYNKNKYLYNGKELQDDRFNDVFFGMLDYGARMYDPQLGRWHVPDPLAELNYNYSPYAYCSNNPIRYVDPYGLDKEDRILRRAIRHANREAKNNPEATVSVTMQVQDNRLYVGVTSSNSEATTNVYISSAKIKDNNRGEGDGGWQPGGIAFVTHEGGASPTKQKSKNPVDEVDVTDLLTALGQLRKSTKVDPGHPLNMAKAIKRFGEAAKNYNELTSDKEINEKSTGNGRYNNWVQKDAIIGNTYEDPTGDSVLLISPDGDSSLFAPFTGHTRKKIPLK